MDYLEIDGKNYRIEYNFNAIGDYLDRTGKSLSDLMDFGSIKAKEMLMLIWCGVYEGERLEGRELELSVEDLGAILAPEDIHNAIDVMTKHMTPHTDGKAAKDDGQQKKRIRWFTKK